MRALAPIWRNDMDHLFDHFFKPQLVERNFSPAVDIINREKEVLLTFDVPGIDEKNLNIEIEDKVLTVSGERSREVDESKDEKTHYFERHYGKFQRSFNLPETIDAESVTADFANGVLKVNLPKKEPALPNKVEIRVNKDE